MKERVHIALVSRLCYSVRGTSFVAKTRKDRLSNLDAKEANPSRSQALYNTQTVDD